MTSPIAPPPIATPPPRPRRSRTCRGSSRDPGLNDILPLRWARRTARRAAMGSYRPGITGRCDTPPRAYRRHRGRRDPPATPDQAPAPAQAGAPAFASIVCGSPGSSGSVHVQAAPWCLPTAPWRAASTRSGSPKISMNPTAAAWSKASPSSYVASALS